MLDCFARLTPQWLKRAHVYCGSVGPFGHDFRYRWAADDGAHIIHAAVYADVCFELAQQAGRTEERDFPWDEAGVSALRQWLQERCDGFFAGAPAPEGRAC